MKGSVKHLNPDGLHYHLDSIGAVVAILGTKVIFFVDGLPGRPGWALF